MSRSSHRPIKFFNGPQKWKRVGLARASCYHGAVPGSCGRRMVLAEAGYGSFINDKDIVPTHFFQ